LLIGSVAMTDTLLTEQTLAAQRPVLFRYALLQLRDSELADDAVQETLLAAWQSAAGFEGKAGLRTWLIGILKHKIADHWRRSAREAVAPTLSRTDEDDGEAEVDDYFMSSGHWNGGPRPGPIPKRH
jgi:Sigma-70 region 2.